MTRQTAPHAPLTPLTPLTRASPLLPRQQICSYAQGMNLIRAKSEEQGWGLNLGEMARIWKGGCIIRAQFLGTIKAAYDRDPKCARAPARLPALLPFPRPAPPRLRTSFSAR